MGDPAPCKVATPSSFRNGKVWLITDCSGSPIGWCAVSLWALGEGGNAVAVIGGYDRAPMAQGFHDDASTCIVVYARSPSRARYESRIGVGVDI